MNTSNTGKTPVSKTSQPTKSSQPQNSIADYDTRPVITVRSGYYYRDRQGTLMMDPEQIPNTTAFYLYNPAAGCREYAADGTFLCEWSLDKEQHKAVRMPDQVILDYNLVMEIPRASSQTEIQSTVEAETRTHETHVSVPTSNLAVVEARSSGYTGDQCTKCNSMRMKIAGHCLVCEDCGETTGCS